MLSQLFKIPPLAFVLDIDGVLIRGPNVIPAAKRALNILEGNNPFKKKIPYILLTNGGGLGEQERCHNLSAKLGVPITTSQYCQAHTIMKKFAHKYADKPVLVLGGVLDTVKKVARGYGYKKAYTTLDVLAWNPSLWPLYTLTESERAVAEPCDFSKMPISAIFCYHDPRNWALDVQVLCDVLLSGGLIGGPYIDGNVSKHEVELVFCNPDLIWRSGFPRPRLGQGAYKAAFQAVFKALSGREYPHVQYGKPTKATYDFARELLDQHIKELYRGFPHPHIYMVGDNPESDIAGANAAGWSSILVNTGVYDPLRGPPRHLPMHFADDLEGAVSWAIEREIEEHQASFNRK